MIRSILKYALIVLLIILALPVILGLMLTSENINRWLFQKVMDQEPRLQLTLTEGQLWRGWAFEQIVWRDEGIEVVVDQVRFAWSANCCSAANCALTIWISRTSGCSPSPPMSRLLSVKLLFCRI